MIVHGHVQGVFFRDTVRRRALADGVAGWVRNTAEGTVEAVFEGSGEAVERLVAFCWEGPRGARVDGLATACGRPTARGRRGSPPAAPPRAISG